MKYIVNSKEVSRNTFYFCQKAKEENKSFVLLKNNNSYDVEKYINNHPEYDYYICDEIVSYFTKGEETVTEWYEKDNGWTKAIPEDMAKRYNKSKFKDTMTFAAWYQKMVGHIRVKLSMKAKSMIYQQQGTLKMKK